MNTLEQSRAASLKRASAPAASRGGVEAPPPSELPALHIAILDDEPFLLRLMADMLQEQGHTVVCFDTPVKALESLSNSTYDVILSDMHMPDMSGIRFYERLCAQNPTQAARILFLTGDATTPSMQVFLARTGSLCLDKPFTQEALRAKIAALLQRCPAPLPLKARPASRQAA